MVYNERMESQQSLRALVVGQPVKGTGNPEDRSEDQCGHCDSGHGCDACPPCGRITAIRAPAVADCCARKQRTAAQERVPAISMILTEPQSRHLDAGARSHFQKGKVFCSIVGLRRSIGRRTEATPQRSIATYHSSRGSIGAELRSRGRSVLIESAASLYRRLSLRYCGTVVSVLSRLSCRESVVIA